MGRLYYSLPVLISAVVVTAQFAVAQKDSTRLNQEVEVIKAYLPSISNAKKINLLPVVDDTARFTPEFIYSIDSKPVKTGFTALPLNAADLKGLPSKELGIGYLKLGAGTSKTPYGEFFLNLPKSETSVFGLHLRHLSSDGKIKLRRGDLVDAPTSLNTGEAFGEINVRNSILSAGLSYNRDATTYYGTPAATTDSTVNYGLKQVYQEGNFVMALKNNEKLEGALKYDVGLRLGFIDAKTGQKGNGMGVFGKFYHNIMNINGILKFSFDRLSTDSITLKNTGITGTKTESWFRAAPSVRLGGDNWSVRGGFNFVAVSDKDGGSMTKLYPDFELDFKPAEGILTLYAGFGGDLKSNSYMVIADENPWTDPKHNIKNVDYQYIISGGFKGKISDGLTYNIALRNSKVKDLHFYIMDSFEGNTSGTGTSQVIYHNGFNAVFDNGSIFGLSAEFLYLSEKGLSFVVKGNYYNYKLENLKFAPQLPDFDFTASSGFRIGERLTGFADFEVIGKRRAQVDYHSLVSSVPTTITMSIDPSIGLNLGATYELTNKFNLFGRIDNLLGRPNEQWLGYASQRTRILAGVAFSF